MGIEVKVIAGPSRFPIPIERRFPILFSGDIYV